MNTQENFGLINLIKKTYHKIPLSNETRQKIRELKKSLRQHLPYRFSEPNPSLWQFGTIQDLYPWRIDQGIDTVVLIQNFYSVFYPQLDTNTKVHLWCYDEQGKLLGQKQSSLAQMETLKVSMRSWIKELSSSAQMGTLLWHIVLPRDVQKQPECQEGHAYFTDRGYICYLKDGVQPCFMHGIDRYAVFQKSEETKFDFFYSPNENYQWIPEIPISKDLGLCSMDFMTLNRAPSGTEIEIEILDSNKNVLHQYKSQVSTRGSFIYSLDLKTISALKNPASARVRGLSTNWSRVMIFRHFENGAISTMHC